MLQDSWGWWYCTFRCHRTFSSRIQDLPVTILTNWITSIGQPYDRTDSVKDPRGFLCWVLFLLRWRPYCSIRPRDHRGSTTPTPHPHPSRPRPSFTPSLWESDSSGLTFCDTLCDSTVVVVHISVLTHLDVTLVSLLPYRICPSKDPHYLSPVAPRLRLSDDVLPLSSSGKVL